MATRVVAVATFEDPVEADRARELLDSRGIRTALVDHEPGPEYGAVFRPITLHVPEDEARQADEILAVFRRSRPDTPEALRAMIASIMVPPFQIYSLWLLARLLPRWRELSLRDRRRVRFAALANLCALIAFAACVLYWVR